MPGPEPGGSLLALLLRALKGADQNVVDLAYHEGSGLGGASRVAAFPSAVTWFRQWRKFPRKGFRSTCFTGYRVSFISTRFPQ
jgi:hypothetical protein